MNTLRDDPARYTPVPYEQLRPGARYRIVIDDCCVEADFIARFDRWEPDQRHALDGAAPRACGTAYFEGGARLRDVVWFAYPV